MVIWVPRRVSNEALQYAQAKEDGLIQEVIPKIPGFREDGPKLSLQFDDPPEGGLD